MPKMTAKYSSARETAFSNEISVNGDQEQLYKRLNENGWWWDSKQSAWIRLMDEPANEPTPKLMVRVWANHTTVAQAASEIIKGLRGQFTLINRSDPYPCRPPRQLEHRIYLEFLPGDGSKGSISDIIRENDPTAIEIE